jgi:anti-anti-sigma regulatory factor
MPGQEESTFMPLPSAKLKVAPTETGICIRVEGQGTLHESPEARDLAVRTLAGDPAATVVFDLSDCEYLDSTFLGCLMELYRLYGKSPTKRYFVAAEPAKRQQLFGPTHIDRLIPMLDAAPPLLGAWVDVAVEAPNKRELVRHVMECHEALATLDCPSRDLFSRIAAQMRAELER